MTQANGVITVAYPTGGTAGDFYLLHVRSELTDYEPFVMADGFTWFAGGGKATSWDTLLIRAHDGTEGADFEVGELVTSFANAQCFLVRGCDPVTPFVLGNVVGFAGSAQDVPTVDVDAVTTTVDNSLVLLGFTTFAHYTGGGATVTAGTVDSQIVLEDGDSIAVWVREVVAAGVEGPWTIDRSNEDLPVEGFDIGGSWWTVVAQPVALDPTPTIEDITTERGFPEGFESIPAPPPRTLYGPNGEIAVIGGATQAEQDALVQAQLDAWAAQVAEEDPVAAFLAAVDGWLTDWDAADASGETALVQELITEWQATLPVIKTLAQGLG